MVTRNKPAKKKTNSKVGKNTINRYEDELSSIKSKLKIGSIILRWCGGVWWYKVVDVRPLHEPHPNAPRRTMRIVAEATPKPPADKKRYFFTDLIQFAEIELHDMGLDGKKTISIIPNYKEAT